MRTPADKRIVFSYYSHPMKDLRERWKAHLVFEAGSTDASEIMIDIVDGLGEPIREGVFAVAGGQFAVCDGVARLTCADFVRGKKDGAIWLYRKGMPPIPGALTFE